MLDKAKLGTRFTCFKCGTKFYDLNRPVPTCPECETDQTEAPSRDVKAMLSKGGRRRARPAPDELDEQLEDLPDDDDDDDDDGDDDLDVLDDDDDDGPDDDDDDDLD